jgi:hypothetical protein
MKKIVLALALLALLPASTRAQNWLTLKAGGGMCTNLGYTQDVNSGITTSFGLGYKHQISNQLLLEGDVLLDSRAAEYYTGKLDANDLPIYFKGAGTYIQVPITLQYMIPVKKKELVPYRMGQPKTFWFIEGGPYVAYGSSVTTFYDPDILDLWTDPDSDTFTTKDLTPRKIDVGITTGIGVNFSIGSKGQTRLIVGTRANYGFLNLFRDDRLGTATNFSALGYIAVDFSLTKRKYIKHRW